VSRSHGTLLPLKRALLTLVVVGAVAVALPRLAGSAAAQQQIDSQFVSASLGANLHFEVYLPDGYDTSTARYPVIYFLHGLPAGSGDYRSIGFVANALEQIGKPAILVMPQGARAGDSDPEYLDRGKGRNWDTAIAAELPRVVDARFRTIPSRNGRALIGLSAGGYGAMHIALEHLSEYSVVESWSGYFHPTNPAGTAPLDLGSKRDNDAANVHRQAKRAIAQLQRLPTLIAFYVGRSDARFAAENEVLNQEMSREGVAHVFRVYDGGHAQSLWQQHAGSWLALALTHLATAQ
jgi:putative tributyrin esterase